ncbi:hypothetical protein [Nocardia sp. NPDC004750]
MLKTDVLSHPSATRPAPTQTRQAARRKAYDTADLRQRVRNREIGVRIARQGAESSQRLSRQPWVIERTIPYLTGYHRRNLRYDRKATHFLAPSPRCGTDLLQDLRNPTNKTHSKIRASALPSFAAEYLVNRWIYRPSQA